MDTRTPERLLPDHARRYELLRQYAESPNAYATLQPFLRHFDAEGGFVAYARSLGGVVVIDDPISPPERREALLRRFLARFPSACFINISHHTALLIRDLSPRHRFLPIGTEHSLDLLNPMTPSAPALSALRRARRHQLELQECDLAELSAAMRQRLLAINQDYLSRSQPGHEIPFVARQCMFIPEPGVRFFLIHHHREAADPDPLRGFLTLDPWHRGGVHHGYQLNHSRFAKTKLWGVYLSLVQIVGELLRAQGYAALSLGACTFYQSELPHQLPMPPGSEYLMNLIHDHADHFHKMSSYTELKLNFPGHELRRFAATPSLSVLINLLRLLRVSSVLSLRVASVQIERALRRL
jgi:lysylphosphatidylglycerol synthetase-like protein (DUF2156 family)